MLAQTQMVAHRLPDGVYTAEDQYHIGSGGHHCFRKNGTAVTGYYGDIVWIFCYQGELQNNRIQVTKGASYHETGSRKNPGPRFEPFSVLEMQKKRFDSFGINSVARLSGTGMSRERSENQLRICEAYFSGPSDPPPAPAKDCLAADQIKFRHLYPVSPYPVFKEYHESRSWYPDPRTTPPNSPDCRKATGNRCTLTYPHYFKRMSSIYITDTKEMVRAFWTVEYASYNETMGTLLAKGNVVWPDPKANPELTQAQQMIVGSTYQVEKADFDCFRPLSESERVRAEQEMARVSSGPEFVRKGMLFIRVDKSVQPLKKK